MKFNRDRVRGLYILAATVAKSSKVLQRFSPIAFKDHYQ